MIQRTVKRIIPVFFILTANVHALTDDKQQLMNIAADSADLNQKTHQGTYTGHVEFTQGSTSIQAAQAITKVDEHNKLTLAIINGEPGSQARFSTKTDADKPPFHAVADQIKYYPQRHLVELIGHARVSQGNNSLAAEKISYDTIEHHVITHGSKTKRIHIVLHPEEKLQ